MLLPIDSRGSQLFFLKIAVQNDAFLIIVRSNLQMRQFLLQNWYCRFNEILPKKEFSEILWFCQKKKKSTVFADCSVNDQKCIFFNRCFCRRLQDASVQVIREIADQNESVLIILWTFLHSKISTKIKKCRKIQKFSQFLQIADSRSTSF